MKSTEYIAAKINLMLAIMIFTDAQLNQPTVQLKSGLSVIGVVNATIDEQKTFHAFRGIPYAEPPVGNLRFKSPVPLPQNLSGRVIDATRDRSKCIQFLYFPTQGSEDCLYINVYSPQHLGNSTELLPVMVWIYGGAFFNGSSGYDEFGPDYLLNENVIIVTFNYRLGVYGFLSTEDDASPGNYGIKDQVLALNWIQENIVYFGGDKNKVTVFGESAGAACIGYLTQTPITKGLFRAAILESGTTLGSWSIVRNPKSIAIKIGRYLNVNTSTSASLVDGLRKVDYERLTEAQFIFGLEVFIIKSLLNYLPFGPTYERPGPEAVITQYSYEKLNAGSFHQIPYLLGYNSQEALAFPQVTTYLRAYLLKYDLLPTELVTPSLNIRNRFTQVFVNHIIKQHYFGIIPVVLSTKSIIQYISDNTFNRPITEAALLYSKYSKVYFYEFSYEGLLGSRYHKHEGVGHAEEINYLWKTSNSDIATKSDKLIRKQMVKLWTNFAKTENPTPKQDPLLHNVIWPIANKNNTFSLKYLNIDKTLTTRINPKWKSFMFWTNLFNKYGNGPFSTY
ncbi:hypothetical protein RN001_008007 [Aquatica leii]|uniref:Carboxylic ester hydrolase n=1 Tax=Aquatica leii TaxID=1421715 RepID=A0AAN7PEK7_9COLE|nr:hypothetical protein RN001_008007 [Aquatica leii]